MSNILHSLDAQALAAIAALGALLTALVNYGQGRIAARTHTAQLYLEFSARYNAPEIVAALIALADWRKKQGAEFAKIFHEQFLANDGEAVQINLHRRTLNRYFLDVAQAYRAGVLNRRFARLAADHPGAAVFRHVVVPMNMLQYRENNSATLRTLMRVVPRFGEGEVF